eukprot:768491-Hanusia_phi.AAC.1
MNVCWGSNVRSYVDEEEEDVVVWCVMEIKKGAVRRRSGGGEENAEVDSGVDTVLFCSSWEQEGYNRSRRGITGAGGVSAGWDHTCAVDAFQKLMCWGDVGVGGKGSSKGGGGGGEPEGKFLAVKTNFHHSCAVHTSGTLMCWGIAFEGMEEVRRERRGGEIGTRRGEWVERDTEKEGRRRWSD